MSLHKQLIPCRRFGRTEVDIPILSVGGMRYQESWKDLSPNQISRDNQRNLERIIQFTSEIGLHHIETARHYGTSERQLGWAFKNVLDPKRILQTKVPPREDPIQFEKELELSFERLQCKKLDLLAIHGLNLPEHLEQTVRPGGCLDVVRRWQKDGRVGHVGFSTHGSTDLIVQAIETDQFDYVNLHWYFIFQDNEPALQKAEDFDLGVFIISPTDKGGHLHTPSPKLVDLCTPLHPIIFNDLFCLTDKRVHTISIGLANLDDLSLHLEAIKSIKDANLYLPIIQKRLINEARRSLGEEWLSSWHKGLPEWNQTPGEINIPVLIWLYNLIKSWGMHDYAKARYRLLGSGGHWFPGSNSDNLDKEVSEQELKRVLIASPWKNEIPYLLRELRDVLGGDSSERLTGI